MARQAGKRRMTLSEHLALRAKAAEESEARERARAHSIQALKELDARVICTCPACVRRRQMSERASERQGE
ncbi:MAG: hypothetical protein J6D34_04825 [Atopobiaceae bacterium]|nr:hypothetical protein [Atopobiaceae bacterium]